MLNWVRIFKISKPELAGQLKLDFTDMGKTKMNSFQFPKPQEEGSGPAR